MPRDTLRGYARWAGLEISRFTRRKRVRTARAALLIAPSFPPPVHGGSYRPLALAQHGPQLGWNMVVIGLSTWESTTESAEQLLETVPPDVVVARVPLVSRYSHARLMPHLDGTFRAALATIDAARLAVGANNPSVVIASGPQFNAFVAGYFLANAFGCSLVLDYRDEWTECPFDFVEAHRSDRFWEKRCLRAADLIVFVTESQLEHHLRVFPFVPRARCVVIPNGWDHEASDGDQRVPIAAPHSKVTLSFVGGLGSFAEPGVFLSAAEAVLRRRPDLAQVVQLRFLGTKDPRSAEEVARFAFPAVLDLVDPVPVPDSIATMRSSTALLSLNPPALGRSLTGKLFNYIASGRPVLVFGEGGEIATLVRELGVGVVIPADDAALEQALDDMVRGTFGAERADGITEWLATHRRATVAERFFHELEALRTSSG